MALPSLQPWVRKSDVPYRQVPSPPDYHPMACQPARSGPTHPHLREHVGVTVSNRPTNRPTNSPYLCEHVSVVAAEQAGVVQGRLLLLDLVGRAALHNTV